MAPSKLREALGAVKDKTAIGLARVGSADDVAVDLDVAIVKATAHGETLPVDERHVLEILTLTCYSRARVVACVASVSRRLGRTRTWAVAVKTLALVHRLLADGDPAYEQELFLATRRGRRLLDMSGFRDRRGGSRSRALDFSVFVRAYAAYLDDRLKLRMQAGGASSGGKWRLAGRRDTDGRDALGKAETPATETTTTTEELVAKALQLKHLLDRFIACRPTGKAKANRVVTAALHKLVKESAVMYCELTEVMAILVDRFTELDTPGLVRVHSIFTSLAKLLDELDDLYAWCKAAAVRRPSEIPEVTLVTQKKLDLMDEFIRDRQASALMRRRSPPAPCSPQALVVTNRDMNAPCMPLVVAAQEEQNAVNAAAAEAAGAIVVVDDDHMADFLNLGEEQETKPLSGEEHVIDLALTLFDGGDETNPAPKWVTFDDPPEDWETALVQSASKLGTQRAELGGGLNTTMLDGMYSHGVANAIAAAANARAFAGSASSVATRSPGATGLALPPPPGGAAAERADPFAASLAVPPPTCVQMTDMQARQRLLVDEQMMWQHFESQRAWSCSNLL